MFLVVQVGYHSNHFLEWLIQSDAKYVDVTSASAGDDPDS